VNLQRDHLLNKSMLPKIFGEGNSSLQGTLSTSLTVLVDI
jgi:hypothetical protein